MLRLLAGVIVQTAGVVDVRVTGIAELAVAPEANGDALNACAPGLLNVMVCAAAAITSATTWDAEPVGLVAVTVKLNVPATVGVPANTPPDVSAAIPVGIVPAVTANVGAGLPLATNVCE